jgi:signal transduction histidine kinase
VNETSRARIGQLPPGEIARLVASHRVSLGAAHTLNNAFTAILGETSLLLGTHRDDPDLQEACGAIRAEIERCARVTKALLHRRSPTHRRGELDLVRTVRECMVLLRDTLSRRIDLEVELPDDLVLIEGSASEIETVVLALVQHVCDLVPRAARVRIAVKGGAQLPDVVLEIELVSKDVPEDAESLLLDPPSTAGLAERAAVLAVRSLATAYGARIEAFGEQGTRAGLRFTLDAFAPDA